MRLDVRLSVLSVIAPAAILGGALAVAGCGSSDSGAARNGDGGSADSSASEVGSDRAADGSSDGATDSAMHPPDAETSDAPARDVQSSFDGNASAQCPAPTMEAGAPVTPPPAVCSPLAPMSQTIANFSGESSAAFALFGTAPLVGGTFIYPACSTVPPEPNNPLFADYSEDNWHITGSVGAFSGFGVYWVVQNGFNGNGDPTYAYGLIDVSAYSGIEFDIAGDPGPLGVITFAMASANQQTPSTDPSRPNCGTCTADAGPCDVVSTTGVGGLTATAQTIRVRWSDLTNARGPGLDVTKVSSLSWYFPWTAGATPYPVDLTLANLRFLPAGAGDAGGD